VFCLLLGDLLSALQGGTIISSLTLELLSQLLSHVDVLNRICPAAKQNAQVIVQLFLLTSEVLSLLYFLLSIIEGKGHLLLIIFEHLISHYLIHLICNFV
jgi:hypothetical protein